MSHKSNRKKFDHICLPGTTYVDYKNLPVIRKYITIFGRIKPRYYTKVPLVVQKSLARAIKNARFMALVPFKR
ncbi:MAG: 30S ribosomal protein S18P, small subunit ribosomal protein S18 [Candidatus Peregrinibacteria bacterium GW2011_GWE2_39_6]|nr:MAG: 30S ribosomal protein S18P, small subunit ribosomal protein S18 [Candidatus Peregrinibacteria bacterium GW2011_GWF2_39_17]KKR26411.1 MAG: 30S ribosomal protein S18P, small subunit ribosomal protein S18 [Candidatus Peregrinibacteria bacterium GW2011_GWE2_39_6]HCW32162.1 30S ribosomal protein S18 [Candidatus Peregrinibacteria bacterium]